TLRLATPSVAPPLARVTVPSGVDPSMNVIVPSTPGLTVADRVIACPRVAFGLLLDRVVVIGTRVTVIVSRADGPVRPFVVPSREARTLKLPTPVKPLSGVNFRPAAACWRLMKSPLRIGVTPSAWKSVPCWRLVIWKLVTLRGPYGLGVMTRPELVCW